MTFDNILQGMNILRNYMDNPDGYHTAAEHDQFFICADRRPNKDDQKALKKLGWSPSEFDDDELLQWTFFT